jgi:hypothetical protein
VALGFFSCEELFKGLINTIELLVFSNTDAGKERLSKGNEIGWTMSFSNDVKRI